MATRRILGDLLDISLNPVSVRVVLRNQRAIQRFTNETLSYFLHHVLNLHTTQKREILTPPVADPGFLSGGRVPT